VNGVCNIKMSFLVKEYNIPFLGKVELIKATGYDESNGKYYAKNDKIGEFCTKCKSVEELMENVSLKVKECIQGHINYLEKCISKEETEKSKLGDVLNEINIMKEESQKEFYWLKQYQTENPLQLEIQDAERLKLKQKGDSKK